ncbi:hypothetical protein CYLTODRAFT_455566 [Cylindrobasidium torrendii FP15055 ss-10]|uniref:Uncharacterized protein n=1 Tax=Cylindrobasidium torrendii FP15055 ss-10 TaxID=1314674 RepID=A0A0D7B7U6_9AGAR|nr:hypothetical protein CYLTODRAFT_455566 [Cylindrobasidium torrendii FP15055 ss-10]
MTSITLPRRPSLRLDTQGMTGRPLPAVPAVPLTGLSTGTSTSSSVTTVFTASQSGSSAASSVYNPPSAYNIGNNARPLPQRPRVAPKGVRTRRSRSASDSRAQMAFDAQTGAWVVVGGSAAGNGGPATAVPKVDKGKGRMHPPLPVAGSGTPPVTPLTIRKHSASRSRPPEHDLNVLTQRHTARKLMVQNPDDEVQHIHDHVIIEYAEEEVTPPPPPKEDSSGEDDSLFRSYVDSGDPERSPSPMRFGRRDSVESLALDMSPTRSHEPPLSPLFTGPAPSPRIEDEMIFSDNPSPTVEYLDDEEELFDVPSRRRNKRHRARSLSPSSSYATSTNTSHTYSTNHQPIVKTVPAKQPAFDPERFAPLQNLAPYTTRGRDPAQKARSVISIRR